MHIFRMWQHEHVDTGSKLVMKIVGEWLLCP